MAQEPSGRLVYVVGPSGSGKDSLLAYARRSIAGAPIAFAHRYITRPVRPDDENHIALSDEEFALRLNRGCLAMHWASHGHQYGVGIEIRTWLTCGLDVVVSGSREYLPRALADFPALALVVVTAPTDVLRARLEARGRETPQSVAARLRRAAAFTALPCTPALEVSNDGPLERAGDALTAYLQRIAATPK